MSIIKEQNQTNGFQPQRKEELPMKIKRAAGLALSVALVLSLSLLPAAAEETAKAHTHTWRTDWASDSRCHWHGCANLSCRTLVPAQAEGYAFHSYDSINDAECNVCGRVRAADPGHDHTWGGGWSSDESHHWHQCTDSGCPGVVPGWANGYAVHTYDSDQDLDCSICGRTRLAGLNHSHTWGAEWESNEAGHWRQCTAAGCPGVVPGRAEGYAAHSYDGIQDLDCNICGRTRPAGLNHSHTWGTEWESNETGHWYQCTAAGCPGVVPGQAKGYAVHVYDSVQDPDCNICGRTRVAFPPSSGLLPAPPVPYADITITGRGQVYARPADARAGNKVTVILTPGEHYTIGSLSVVRQDGGAVAASDNGDGTWTFIQPEEKVRFRAVFLPAYQACSRGGQCPLAACGDLSPEGWYHNGIHYCLDWGLMSGSGQSGFLPGGSLSGGMMAQILYNLAGRPELPGKTAYTGTGAWYDSAVAWGVGAGVMNVEDGFWKFSPTEDVTREQLAIMLWRYAGRPAPSAPSLSFSDAGAVSEWAVPAVRWAVDRGILRGRDNGCLDPGGKVTRAEAASMLVRFLEGTPD